MFGSNRLLNIAVGGWLGLLVAQALAQEAAPSVLESQPVPEVQESPDQKGAKGESKKEDDPPIDPSPALNQIESAIRDLVTQQRSTQSNEPAEHEIKDLKAQEDMAWWAKLMFFATAVATGLTAVGVFLVWRTLVHTRRAAEHAGGMLEEARKTTKAARDSVAAARRGADAAYQGVSEARASSIETIRAMDETAERQLRAYVGVQSIIRKHGSGTGPAWVLHVTLKNYGQTPAYDLVIRCGRVIREVADDHVFSSAADLPPNAPVYLAPGEISVTVVDVKTLIGPEWTYFKNGKTAIYVCGRVDFRGAFDEDRWLEFQRFQTFDPNISSFAMYRGDKAN